MNPRRFCIVLAIPPSCYVSFVGTIANGFCPGYGCVPETFAWMALAPSLLLAIWSARAASVVIWSLIILHVAVELHFGEHFSVDLLWGADKGLDIWLWIVAILMTVAAILPRHREPTTTSNLN